MIVRLPSERLTHPVRNPYADEVATDASLARRLVAAQFPQWADLEVEPVEEDGTENATYRLGDELCVRLPRPATGRRAGGQGPSVVAHARSAAATCDPRADRQGHAGRGLPLRVGDLRLASLASLATRIDQPIPFRAVTDMAGFPAALQRVDTTGGSPAAAPHFPRTSLFRTRDAQTREAIAALHGEVDVEAVTEMWEQPAHPTGRVPRSGSTVI